MKIGILTYHRSNNYGALLQAVALRHVFENMGHQATFIDYWPAYHIHMYSVFSIRKLISENGFKRKLLYLKLCLKNLRVRKRRISNFNVFISKNIIPYTSSINETYDIVVHGSDQIWRKQPEVRSYNPVYFGKHNIKASKKVSYAASLGILPNKEPDRIIIKELLSNLDAISVRERELLNLVQSFGYKDARQDLDPTLLLTSKDWVEMFDLKKNETVKKYVLYYKIKDSFDVNSLRQFARSKGLALKIIYSRAIGKDTDSQITTADPKQFLDLIYNADFVCTSSFHGLAFSLIFHKQFLASFTNNAGRAASLLEALDLSDYLISPKEKKISQKGQIDYVKVDSRIKQISNKSIEYCRNLECL